MKCMFFPYYGGKSRVIEIIVFLIPSKIEKWYELFGGSGVVTLNMVRHKIEVLNDFDPNVANLHYCMSNEKFGKELKEKLINIEYSKETFDKARADCKKEFTYLGDVDRAVSEYIVITQSFNSARKDWRKWGNTVKYQRKIIKNIHHVYRRLQGVEVTNRDAIEMLNDIEDDENTFIFLDPPYVQDLRSKGARNVYRCELKQSQQVMLLEKLQKIKKSKVILCGYKATEGDLYDRYLLNYGWKRYKVAELKKPNYKKGDSGKGVEWIWVNYELPEMAKYKIDLSTCNADE